MNISDEKKYLYDMIADLIADRRRTIDLIYDFKSRLNEIIRLESLGLNEIPIQSIVDLHNVRDIQRMTTNFERETNHIIRKTEEEVEVNPVEREAIPKVEPKIEFLPRVKIEEEKEKVSNQSPTRKSRGMPLNKAAEIIAHILKEKGIPLKAKDLHALVNEQVDTPIELGNFTKNTLPRSSKLNPRINNVSRGYWQYLNK